MNLRSRVVLAITVAVALAGAGWVIVGWPGDSGNGAGQAAGPPPRFTEAGGDCASVVTAEEVGSAVGRAAGWRLDQVASGVAGAGRALTCVFRSGDPDGPMVAVAVEDAGPGDLQVRRDRVAREAVPAQGFADEPGLGAAAYSENSFGRATVTCQQGANGFGVSVEVPNQDAAAATEQALAAARALATKVCG